MCAAWAALKFPQAQVTLVNAGSPQPVGNADFYQVRLVSIFTSRINTHYHKPVFVFVKWQLLHAGQRHRPCAPVGGLPQERVNDGHRLGGDVLRQCHGQHDGD